MSAALTLANGVEEAFLGRVPTDAFCSEVGSVFFCCVFVSTLFNVCFFYPDRGNYQIFPFAKKEHIF